MAGLDAEARERYRLDRSKVLSIHLRMVQKIYGTGPGACMSFTSPPFFESLCLLVSSCCTVDPSCQLIFEYLGGYVCPESGF